MGHLFIFIFLKKKKKKSVYYLLLLISKSEGKLKCTHMGISSEKINLNQTAGTRATF